MVAKNDVTGDSLRTRAANKNYDEGWERIFGKKKKEESVEESVESSEPKKKEEEE